MNRLHALSAGPGVETGRFAGVVHSVFARACNLSLDDGRLLSLLAAEYGNAPGAVRVDAPAGFAFDRALGIGERAACRGGVLRVGAGVLEVRLGGASRWRARVDAIAFDPVRPRVGRAWRTALNALRRHDAERHGTGPGVPRRRITALYRVVRRLDESGAPAAVNALAGVGRGLTPAGDDILVGVLAGLHAGAAAVHEGFLDAFASAVRRAAARTNRVSAQFLLHAADGAFAEPLARVTTAIARGEGTDVVERAAERTLAVGATSGGDGLRGLLIALRVLAARRSSRVVT